MFFRLLIPEFLFLNKPELFNFKFVLLIYEIYFLFLQFFYFAEFFFNFKFVFLNFDFFFLQIKFLNFLFFKKN